MVRRTISGIGFDNFNFPTDITAVTTPITDVQADLINTGALDQVQYTDPFGRTSTAYKGFQNPHSQQVSEIASLLNNSKKDLPDGWNAPYSSRTPVPASVLGTSSDRVLTDAEINDINFVDDVLKDFTYLTNRQSGMDIAEQLTSPWSMFGNSAYGSVYSLPTTPGFPGGVSVPNIGGLLSASSAVNRLATHLTNVPDTGPCALIGDVMEALMKGAEILAQILNKLKEVLGFLAKILGILALVKLLADLMKRNLENIGKTIEMLKQLALAGLLEQLMKDPCMRYIIESVILTAGTVEILKRTNI